MILYEPSVAEENDERSWGSDGISIRYPSVNTCVTLTYVYPGFLVGAHFGLLEKDGSKVTYGRVYSMLGLMGGLAPAATAPSQAFLIGNKSLWDDEASEKLTLLRQDIFNRTDEYLGYEPEYETGEYSGGTVDIEIFHYGLITIRSTDGQTVDTFNFGGGGGLSSAARGRLGL